MRTPVSAAVVGGLDTAEELALAFEQLPQAELRWLCKERTPRAAMRHRGVRYTDRFDDLLEDEKLDAIAVAAPAAARYELAAAALEADKHVYVAGALAKQGDQADSLLQQARRRGRSLFAGDLHLCDPAVAKLEALLASGELGDVLYIRGEQQIPGRAPGEDDLLWGPGADLLALVLHLLADEPLSVEARSETYLDPSSFDLLHCWLSFATGITAQIHLSSLDARPLSKITVVGSSATAVLDCSVSNPGHRLTLWAKGTNDRTEGTVFAPGDVVSPQVGSEDPVRRSCELFLSAVRSALEPVSRAREAVILVEVLEGVQRSLVRGASVELGTGRSAQDLRLVGTPPAV